MEGECQRTRLANKIASRLSLTNLRTAFFLHVYHENHEAGGVKSMLYLREAITMAQMMRLHQGSSYVSLSLEEQQLRRRILWLLFVTERGVSILHKLPVVLKPSIVFPTNEIDDENCILPAFQKLLSLFWAFDQSGIFDIFQDSDCDVFGFDGNSLSDQISLDSLQRKLQEVPVGGDTINDVQRADICVTRQWLRVVLWRLTMAHGIISSMAANSAASQTFPVQIAREFLGVISQLPNSALEAHGLCMELKIYEIASSVADSIAYDVAISRMSSGDSADRPRDILTQLQRILSSCRGGNKRLVAMLCNKIAEAQTGQQLLLEPRSGFIEEMNKQWQQQGNELVASDVEPTEQQPPSLELSSYHFQQTNIIDCDGLIEPRNLTNLQTESETSISSEETLFATRPRQALPQVQSLPYSWDENISNIHNQAFEMSQGFRERLQNLDDSFGDIYAPDAFTTLLSENEEWNSNMTSISFNLSPEPPSVPQWN